MTQRLAATETVTITGTPPDPDFAGELLKIAVERWALPMLAAMLLAKDGRLSESATAYLEKEQRAACAALDEVTALFPSRPAFLTRATAHLESLDIPITFP